MASNSETVSDLQREASDKGQGIKEKEQIFKPPYLSPEQHSAVTHCMNHPVTTKED